MRVLDDERLRSLYRFAKSLSLDVLVETHDEKEIERAVAAGCGIIGVNCRDLRTFSTDKSLIERLIGLIPPGIVRVAESGMHTREDIERAEAAGADAFLVGTALMRAAAPAAALRELLERFDSFTV